MSEHFNEQFSTREMLSIVRSAGIPLDGAVVRDWHRRGILSGEGAGRGVERTYTFRELLVIYSLAYLAERVRFLGEASGLAERLAAGIEGVYATGPDGNVAQTAPIYLLVMDRAGNDFEQVATDFRFGVIAEIYTGRAPVIVAPGFLAMDLWNAVRECLEARKRG